MQWESKTNLGQLFVFLTPERKSFLQGNFSSFRKLFLDGGSQRMKWETFFIKGMDSCGSQRFWWLMTAVVPFLNHNTAETTWPSNFSFFSTSGIQGSDCGNRSLCINRLPDVTYLKITLKVTIYDTSSRYSSMSSIYFIYIS